MQGIGHNSGSQRGKIVTPLRPYWLPHPGLLAFVLALWVMASALQFSHLFPH
jgi:hypothetical protein